MIAAGLGCRKNCSVDDILGAIAGALKSTGRSSAEIAVLCAPDFKAGEAALTDAARQLDRPLVFLPKEKLATQAAGARTCSDRVLAIHDLPSVAETAALAGATPARLLAPRFNFGGAACALAESIGRVTP